MPKKRSGKPGKQQPPAEASASVTETTEDSSLLKQLKEILAALQANKAIHTLVLKLDKIKRLELEQLRDSRILDDLINHGFLLKINRPGLSQLIPMILSCITEPIKSALLPGEYLLDATLAASKDLVPSADLFVRIQKEISKILLSDFNPENAELICAQLCLLCQLINSPQNASLELDKTIQAKLSFFLALYIPHTDDDYYYTEAMKNFILNSPGKEFSLFMDEREIWTREFEYLVMLLQISGSAPNLLSALQLYQPAHKSACRWQESTSTSTAIDDQLITAFSREKPGKYISLVHQKMTQASYCLRYMPTSDSPKVIETILRTRSTPPQKLYTEIFRACEAEGIEFTRALYSAWKKQPTSKAKDFLFFALLEKLTVHERTGHSLTQYVRSLAEAGNLASEELCKNMLDSNFFSIVLEASISDIESIKITDFILDNMGKQQLFCTVKIIGLLLAYYEKTEHLEGFIKNIAERLKIASINTADCIFSETGFVPDTPSMQAFSKCLPEYLKDDHKRFLLSRALDERNTGLFESIASQEGAAAGLETLNKQKFNSWFEELFNAASNSITAKILPTEVKQLFDTPQLQQFFALRYHPNFYTELAQLPPRLTTKVLFSVRLQEDKTSLENVIKSVFMRKENYLAKHSDIDFPSILQAFLNLNPEHTKAWLADKTMANKDFRALIIAARDYTPSLKQESRPVNKTKAEVDSVGSQQKKGWDKQPQLPLKITAPTSIAATANPPKKSSSPAACSAAFFSEPTASTPAPTRPLAPEFFLARSMIIYVFDSAQTFSFTTTIPVLYDSIPVGQEDTKILLVPPAGVADIDFKIEMNALRHSIDIRGITGLAYIELKLFIQTDGSIKIAIPSAHSSSGVAASFALPAEVFRQVTQKNSHFLTFKFWNSEAKLAVTEGPSINLGPKKLASFTA